MTKLSVRKYNKPTCCKSCVHNPLCKHPHNCPVPEAENRREKEEAKK